MENQNLIVDVPKNATLFTLIEPSQKEVLRLEPNGDIYVNGELCDDDKAIVGALRTFAKSLNK